MVGARAQLVQHQQLLDLIGRERVRQVALVGKDEQARVAQRVVEHQLVQLLRRLLQPLAVVRVDDKDEALRAGEVVPPQRADAVLTAHVPNAEAPALVLPRLDVEVHRRDRRHVLLRALLATLELEQHRRLSGAVEAGD